MGCVCKPSYIKIKLNKSENNETNTKNGTLKKDYFNKISKNSWAHIINHLMYKDLREAGKVNR
jgi:Fe-S cluster biosynthesis and repair protein YggX